MKINYLWLSFIAYSASFFAYLTIPEKLLKIHLDPGDLHVHHFTYGIIILSVGYYLALISERKRAKIILAVLYGFGLFLVADEIEMWLWLKPVIDGPFRHLPAIIVMAVFPSVMAVKHFLKKK